MGLYQVKCPSCEQEHLWFSGNSDQRCPLCKSKTEIARLKQVVLNNLQDNDEYGCEFTYVQVLKEENKRFRDALDKIANMDFRGNRPIEATIAYNALNPVGEKVIK